MSLFKNRKRSGMVLTGVVLSSGVVSAVNQSVAGANNTLGILDSPGVSGALGSVAGKGTKASGSTVATFFKKYWDWFLVALGLIVVAGVIIYYKMVSNSVNGEFKNLFCSDEMASDEFKKKFFEKTSDFEGCVLNMSVDELVESCCKNEELEKFLEKHKDVERVDVLISEVIGGGFFTLGLLDEQGKMLVRNIYTKRAVENEDALNSLCNNFDSNKRGVYFKEMPFGKVFRFTEEKKVNDEICVKNWEKIRKFEGYIYKVSIKEFSLMVGGIDDFDDTLKGCEGKIKIRIDSVMSDGCLELYVLDEKNKYLCTLGTKYATADADDLNKLATYLSENRVSGETLFSEVLRYSSHINSTWVDKDVKNFGAWKGFKGLEKKKIDIKIKELRSISSVDSYAKQELLNDLEGEEVKVAINSVKCGYLVLDVFSKGDEKLLFTVNTRHAVKDNDAIGRLVKYLEDKAEKKENVKGNVNENNDIGMNINADE